ncbi:uncharacterized protein EI97DRAFT_374085 [Westerdykella ornata]|uniref:Uncharacterized protein n=1 Tax=Westerdykella ornata TaxID=318751 RepID=A0A6A6JNU0_WESOR|nr:uncharacterized protein EI97DRAFT_374085 [Westerdykella ornata]KAF2277813.1 hypothetical protein EI97DRAFT_374085 [Westerdykella ornata]
MVAVVYSTLPQDTTDTTPSQHRLYIIQPSPDNNLNAKIRSTRQKTFSGTKFALRSFAILTTTILFSNIGWLKRDRSRAWKGEMASRRRCELSQPLACFLEKGYYLPYPGLRFSALQSLSTSRYDWAVVTETFLTGAPFDETFSFANREIAESEMRDFAELQSWVKSYERIENGECLRTYGNGFQTTRRHVALVSSESNSNTSILAYGTTYGASETTNGWVCSSDDWCNTALLNPATWSVYDHPISYCLSERIPEACSVKFSFEIMKILIAFNAIKLVVMVYVLWRFDAEDLIATTGDAVASFLKSEDPTTHHMCLANKRNLRVFWNWPRTPKPYPNNTKRWHLAVSKTRWLVFIISLAACIGLVTIFLVMGIVYLREKSPGISLTGLWKMGIGTINANALVWVLDEGFINTVIAANVPQLFLAALWILHNSIVCPMFSAVDWDSFSFHPKTLMVASPAGKQRGTWLLGAPLLYGGPLVILHILTHWIVSQSIFVVQAETYDRYGGLLPDDTVSNCGYSPIAIIFTLVLGLLIFAITVALGLRKFSKGGAPVVSTCTAAISAACHPGIALNEEAVYNDFMWAEVGAGWTPVGHCSLISGDILMSYPGYARKPVEGRLYA